MANGFNVFFDDDLPEFDDPKHQQFTEFICPKCKIREMIPTEVVMHFDFMDGGDPAYPPRFDCEKCNGKMVPIYFVGHTGIVYEYKE